MNNLQGDRSLSPEKLGLLELLLKRKGIAAQRNPGILRRKERGPVPLSFAQQRLWFLDQLEPGNPAYNVPAAIRLTGPLNIAAVRQSLDEVVRRHESLRTIFATMDDQPVQIVKEPEPVALSIVDLQEQNPDQLERHAVQLATEEARRPFDISREAPFRVLLLKLGPGEHVILVTMHHIASDLFSRLILVREIAALYEAYSRNLPPALPELPIQYADYAVWQRQRLQGDVLDEQLRYWKTQLRDAPEILELPTDYPRPANRSYRGARLSFSLPDEVVAGLKRLSSSEGATLFMALTAAFQTLLQRYTQQPEISIGTPVAGRTRTETEGLIGFFVNTLVLRTDFSGDPTFRELLRRVKDVSLGAYAHQEVPFEKLVEELEVQRSLSHTPLFQVMLGLQLVETGDLNFSGLQLNQVDLERTTAKFDLNVEMLEIGSSVQGMAEYSTDLFEEQTIIRLLGHFEELLKGVVADPDRRVSELPLLKPAERTQLLVEWNQTARKYTDEQLTPQRIEKQAVRAPEMLAVVAGEQQISYSDLNERANQVAHYLASLGTRTESIVGVCMERSIEMVVALLGILKAGAAYLPLDPDYPSRRLTHMLEDSQVEVVLTQQHLRDVIPAGNHHLWTVDSEWEMAGNFPRHNPACRIEPDNLAYVIYTSGSTGLPKAAMNTHGGLANRLSWMQEAYQLTPADRVMQKTPFSFDVSVWEFFWPLMVGAQLVMARPGGHQDPAYLIHLIEVREVTTMHFVPSMLQIFLDQPGLENSGSLRQVFCSGEALPFGLKEKFRERMSAELHNLYGPTEAAIDVTFWPCSEGTEKRIVPIGRPIANTEIYLLDGRMEPVPIGVAGELYIGGTGLARGYLRRADLTASRFVPHRFEPGRRLYRTGDRARYLPDGNIEFLGRLDQQIKLRGFRIELEEIESVLGNHPDVRECVVVSHRRDDVDQQLVAYVVCDASVGLENVRAYLQESVPGYMVPSVLIPMPQLPLTANGKLDRQALPDPYQRVQENLARTYEAAQTQTEEVVAGVWAQVLRVARVGRAENFFSVGGHSLLATQVMSRLREIFEVELSLRTIFEHPTVQGLAAAVDKAQVSDERRRVPPIVPVSREMDLPLSFAQQRLWFLDQLESESPFYNLPAVFRLSGDLDLAVLHRALLEVISRHEVLRTTFPMIAGQPRLRIQASGGIDLPIVDLSALPALERDRVALELATREVRGHFDLGHGPLMRMSLFRLDQAEHMAVIVMHHIVSDGWSLTLLMEEVASLYGAFANDRPSPLPALPVQYADFAYWQRNQLRGEVLDEQLRYWKQQLGGDLPVLKLATDRPRPNVQTFRGTRYTHRLPLDLVQAVRDLGRREGVTLFMTLLAAYQTLLHHQTGAEDICVGSPVANRPQVETEQLIGCFLNTLVLRTDLSGDPTFRELLRRVRECTLNAYLHQDIPFEKLVEVLQPKRTTSHSPLFQVTFSLLNTPPAMMAGAANLTLTPIEIDTGTAQFDLLLLAAEAGDELSLTFMYNTDLFEASFIERLMSNFENLLGSVAQNAETRLSKLEPADKAEKVRHPMQDKQREESRRKKFMAVKPRQFDFAPANLVTINELVAGTRLPMVIRPALKDVDLVEWVTANRELVLRELAEGGGVLFRDFGLKSVSSFQHIVNALLPDTMKYQERSTPRTEVAENIYTSTEYPAEQSIALHNEFSYARSWPMNICFFCQQAAAVGGQTPIADSRRVYARIDPEVRERFATKQVMYIRNYGSGIDLPWQTVFQTSERAEVEAYCRAARIEWEWGEGDRLRTSQVRQAVARHPRTGEMVWFNQAHLFHITNLEEGVREPLLESFGEERLPRQARYGDGTPIAAAALDEVRRAYAEESVDIDWQTGDVLVLNNMLVAHGRRPYSGARRVLAAMGEVYHLEEEPDAATRAIAG